MIRGFKTHASTHSLSAHGLVEWALRIPRFARVIISDSRSACQGRVGEIRTRGWSTRNFYIKGD